MKKKSSLGKDLAAIGIALLATPFLALLSTATLSTLWRWFAESQYGAGPTTASWYGLSLLAYTLVIRPIAVKDAMKDDDSKADAVRALRWQLTHALSYAVVLAGAWVIGTTFGWKA